MRTQDGRAVQEGTGVSVQLSPPAVSGAGLPTPAVRPHRYARCQSLPRGAVAGATGPARAGGGGVAPGGRTPRAGAATTTATAALPGATGRAAVPSGRSGQPPG